MNWGNQGPTVLAVNPGSMLGSKMVKDAYGVSGGDINIGADILTRAGLSEEFEGVTGKYYDNDSRKLSLPHPSGNDLDACRKVTKELDELITSFVK